ncbi:putative orfan [Tupanvirus soda lake]|uniref:Orfan n=2 Tax=Tupanvirus TaxID=2094720 RepID=A0AC62ABT4_9VIRU|nr:putative orfan [Tupanvirus soda lake]QKU35221.1 putative orfan [Tupanvirus soda lake]
MTRTVGHQGSRHAYWKHQNSHSSNKKNKKDSHKRKRSTIRGIMSNVDKILDRDISEFDFQEDKYFKICGCTATLNGMRS